LPVLPCPQPFSGGQAHVTNEVADWTGNGRRLRSRTSTVNDSTGSTIKIIIVGPMIDPAAC